MSSDRLVTVALVALVALCTEAQARDASPTAPTDVEAVSDDQEDVPLDPNCSADEKRQRRAARARDKRMVREAISATRATIANAESIASDYWEEADDRWFANARARGRQILDSWRTAVGSLPSPALCEILATRRPDRCTSLTSIDERRACSHWHEVWEHGRPTGRCDDASESVQPACRMVAAGPPWRCPSAPDGTLDLCGRAANVLQAAEATCGAPPDPHLCTWSLWMRTIRGTGDVCALVEGAGPGPKRPGIAGRCRAVAEGRPALCAAGGAPTAQGRPPVIVHAEAAVSMDAFAPHALVSVQADTPAVCGVLTRLISASGDEAHRNLQVIPLNSWAPVELRQPIPPGVQNTKGLKVQTSATCAVRATW